MVLKLRLAGSMMGGRTRPYHQITVEIALGVIIYSEEPGITNLGGANCGAL